MVCQRGALEDRLQAPRGSGPRERPAAGCSVGRQGAPWCRLKAANAGGGLGRGRPSQSLAWLSPALAISRFSPPGPPSPGPDLGRGLREHLGGQEGWYGGQAGRTACCILVSALGPLHGAGAPGSQLLARGAACMRVRVVAGMSACASACMSTHEGLGSGGDLSQRDGARLLPLPALTSSSLSPNWPLAQEMNALAGL